MLCHSGICDSVYEKISRAWKNYAILEQSFLEHLPACFKERKDNFMDTTILIVDDDRDYLDILRGKLLDAGFRNITAKDDPLKAAVLVEKKKACYDIALIDMTMPEMDGLTLLEVIKSASPRTECIMVTAINEARIAVECLKKGAYDYLVKPITEEDLIFSMRRTMEKKRLLDVLDIEKGKILPQLLNPTPFKSILTQSQSVLRVLKEAELHAGSDVPVLITGESGTGKELLARAIHMASPRSDKPFMPVNMASVTGSLFESEFFGHTRGAFTGAENRRAGYLEHTSGGTLFLDEIGNMPSEMQGKMLRVLQDGEYTKLGTDSHRRADIRFIAATNADLNKQMNKGVFRQDLYYRIRGGWLHLPPLRDRHEDIPLLAEQFLQEHCGGGKYCRIEEEAIYLLMAHHWPGNIRELKSVIQSAANLSQGKAISPDALPDHLLKRKSILKCAGRLQPTPIAPLAQIEKRHILNVYEQTGLNKSRTARLLDIGLNTLRRRLKVYGVA